MQKKNVKISKDAVLDLLSDVQGEWTRRSVEIRKVKDDLNIESSKELLAICNGIITILSKLTREVFDLPEF